MIKYWSFYLAITLCFITCRRDETQSSFEQQVKMVNTSPYKNLKWRNVGPDHRSGRATDVWGITGDTNTIWAAFATGGLWKTDDAGANWKPLFDKEATLSIGNIAIAPSNNKVVYVGTGEANIFRASLRGVGVYKTMDGGKTFSNIGLEKTGTIARIVVHPKNENVVYVAASGNEWTYNNDRGLYKTEDGGKSWAKILGNDDKSGCIDVVIDPKDPNIIYASMWNRIRKRYSDPIPEDGDYIYKSVDAGKSWKKLTNGLPDTKLTGRIGLAIAASNPNVIYAFVDDHNKKRDPEKGETDSYQRLVKKVVIGGVVYRSSDKGETWTKQAEIHDFFKPFSGTYGWVFGQVRVNPKNENEVYVLGVNMGKSIDGGKTWSKFESKDEFIHGDNHGLWFDAENPQRILLANDGGISMTNDGGLKWKNFFSKIPTTQFYTVTYDMNSPYNIYGSVQDEGTFSASIKNTFGTSKDTSLRNWSYAPGGEGTQIRINPKQPNIVYSSSFYGRLMRSDMSLPEDKRSVPITQFEVGRIDSLRAEWLAGTIISKFDSKTIYHGLQHLYKSSDDGKTWEKISDDLSYNDKSKVGNYPYLIYHQTITAIEEASSPGELYVGTDDGRMWYTSSDGNEWTEITNGLPLNKHVIKITSSSFNPNVVYLALNDRRSDNDDVLLFMSTNKGKTWTSISGNLPNSPANVIIEHPEKENVLFCGTDIGPYISTDKGKSWHALTCNLPYSVSVNDMFIHPRDKNLVIATYGRGVWTLDKLPL